MTGENCEPRQQTKHQTQINRLDERRSGSRLRLGLLGRHRHLVRYEYDENVARTIGFELEPCTEHNKRLGINFRGSAALLNDCRLVTALVQNQRRSNTSLPHCWG